MSGMFFETQCSYPKQARRDSGRVLGESINYYRTSTLHRTDRWTNIR